MSDPDYEPMEPDEMDEDARHMIDSAYEIEQGFEHPEDGRAALTRIIRLAYEGWRSGADRLDEIGAIAGAALGMSDKEIGAYANAVMEDAA